MATTGARKESSTSRQRTRRTQQTQRTEQTQQIEQTQRAQGAQGSRREDVTPRTAPTARTATINLPFVTAQFRAPDVRVPKVRVPDVRIPKAPVPHARVPGVSRREVSDLVGAVGSYLPSRDKTLYYAGLGAMAAFQIIEWPVAVAIGAGTVVAQRALREGNGAPERVAAQRHNGPSTA